MTYYNISDPKYSTRKTLDNQLQQSGRTQSQLREINIVFTYHQHIPEKEIMNTLLFTIASKTADIHNVNFKNM